MGPLQGFVAGSDVSSTSKFYFESPFPSSFLSLYSLLYDQISDVCGIYLDYAEHSNIFSVRCLFDKK